MSRSSHFYSKLFSLKLAVLSLLFLISSCIPNNPGTNKSKQNEEQTTTTTSNGGQTQNQPTFLQSGVFLDNGITQSYSLTEVQIDSGINLLMRGQQVHNFLVNSNNASNVVCLVTSIVEEVNNKWLVIAASPGQLFNYSTSTKEFYYSVSINNETLNRTFCQKSGLMTELSKISPFDSIAYSLNTICDTCSQNFLNSGAINLYQNTGAQITNIESQGLRFKLKNTPTIVATGETCTNASQCQGAGFDCCSEQGFCINDKTLKSGVNQSSAEFLQAKNDILANPANIYNYSNFYYLCPVNISDNSSNQTSTQELTADEVAALSLQKLKDLYDCTTLLQGEMSVCTSYIWNATTQDSFVHYTADDDKNFTTTYSGNLTIPQHSIKEINHSGQILFKDGVFYREGEVKIGANNSLLGNDSLTDPTVVELHRSLPTTANYDLLRIRFMIDGSCEYVNSLTAKCVKYYTQGQNKGYVDDHFPASNTFLLPNYLDLNKTITVKVDGVIKFRGSDWDISTFTGSKIEFLGSSLKVYDQQTVTIEYFVDLQSNNVLNSKLAALEEIRAKCGCADTNCRLKPYVSTLNGKEVVSDYICDYPEPNLAPAPMQQIVMLSAKTVPMRYFDENGASHATIDIETPKQEGLEFEYINRDLLRPNNVTQYIGINEVFGSFNTKSESAKPAKEIRVDKGKVYDVYVDSGTFSTCFNCGVDYHSHIAKIFPSNFLHRGGGWEPQAFETSRRSSTEYRGDDILFGRACFVPPTMIPWSHHPMDLVQRQRTSRLETQHFYFANGYNRDWYGFDYGSVIGSFDGVKWFSIGNSRRIKAESNKMFIAINAYMGDLTMESTFQVSIIDSTISRTSIGVVSSDFASDGAQCQKYHQCSNDKDCVTNLGWEYTCESVNTLSSNWPVFDSLANELNNEEQNVRLYSLFSASAGGAKRCVYRGRGTPCDQGMTYSTVEQSFNGTLTPGTISCAQNFYCQEFIQGAKAKKFNTKIARYGKGPDSQNLSSLVEEDTLDSFGLHARYTGRPYSYIGEEEVTPVALNNLSHNNVLGLCLPGRNPNSFSNTASLASTPPEAYQGDKVLNLGMTLDTARNGRFLTSCPALDTDGELFHFKDSNISANLDAGSNTELYNLSSGQNFSTSHLNIFEAIQQKNITEVFENKQISMLTLEENRCLRAPGATCFTDLECSGNEFINTFMNRISPDDTNAQSVINKNEILFWQEKLICSQERKTSDPDYKLSDNRCCREMGKDITIPTKINQSGFSSVNKDDTLIDFDNNSIPGVDIDLDDKKRYSRNAVVHYEKADNADKYPTLEVQGKNKCQEGGCGDTSELVNQFFTLGLYAEKTCCNKNWIRNFHKDNGGGHRWSPGKMQTFDKKYLKCYNWITYDNGRPAGAKDYDCGHVDSPDDPGCFLRNLSEPLYSPILELMGEIELLGVPQVTVKSYQYSGMQCTVNIDDMANPTVYNIVPGIFNDTTLADDTKAEYTDSGLIRYSARDKENFHDDLKMIFSEDKLTCCLPAGTEVEAGTNKDQCCTGFINETTGRCALPDYSDISVYFNRYISSEANGLADSLFNKSTGYIKDITTTINLACQKSVCASNCIALGVGVSNLVTPGHEEADFRYKRFIDGDDDEVNNRNGLADVFNAGAKWNNHAYCFPVSDGGCNTPDGVTDLILTQCQ